MRETKFFSVGLILLSILVLFLACSNDTLNLSDLSDSNDTASRAVKGITQLALNLTVSSTATGTFTVQIRNATGTSVLWTRTVTAGALGLGTTGLKYLNFSALSLTVGQKYRIYVTRSVAHTPSNAIYWNTSTSGNNAYPQGSNDVAPSWVLDYAFATYTGYYIVNQSQTQTGYGFATGNNLYRWQEFIVN